MRPRALAVGWRIDDGDHEPLICEQLPRANEEVPFAPLERTIGEDLQAPVSAREQDHGSLRRRRRQHEHSLRHAGAGRDVHDALRGAMHADIGDGIEPIAQLPV